MLDFIDKYNKLDKELDNLYVDYDTFKKEMTQENREKINNQVRIVRTDINLFITTINNIYLGNKEEKNG